MSKYAKTSFRYTIMVPQAAAALAVATSPIINRISKFESSFNIQSNTVISRYK